MRFADLLRRAEPLVRVGRRHADVDDGDVGLVHRDVAEQVVGCAGLRDDVEPRLLEQTRDALPEEHRVVRQDDPPCVTELRDGAAKRREVARQAVGEHLVDRLRVRQPLETVRPEVAGLDFRDERRRRRREQDLAAVARRRDPRRADHVEARVPLVTEMRDTRMEPHPHLHDDPVGPPMVADPRLPGERRAQSRLNLVEDGRDLVACCVDLGAAVRCDLLAQQAADVGDEARVAAPGAPDELGRALDVREEEGDGSGWQRVHHEQSRERIAKGWTASGARVASGDHGESP